MQLRLRLRLRQTDATHPSHARLVPSPRVAQDQHLRVDQADPCTRHAHKPDTDTRTRTRTLVDQAPRRWNLGPATGASQPRPSPPSDLRPDRPWTCRLSSTSPHRAKEPKKVAQQRRPLVHSTASCSVPASPLPYTYIHTYIHPHQHPPYLSPTLSCAVLCCPPLLREAPHCHTVDDTRAGTTALFWTAHTHTTSGSDYSTSVSHGTSCHTCVSLSYSSTEMVTAACQAPSPPPSLYIHLLRLCTSALPSTGLSAPFKHARLRSSTPWVPLTRTNVCSPQQDQLYRTPASSACWSAPKSLMSGNPLPHTFTFTTTSSHSFTVAAPCDLSRCLLPLLAVTRSASPFLRVPCRSCHSFPPCRWSSCLRGNSIRNISFLPNTTCRPRPRPLSLPNRHLTCVESRHLSDGRLLAHRPRTDQPSLIRLPQWVSGFTPRPRMASFGGRGSKRSAPSPCTLSSALRHVPSTRAGPVCQSVVPRRESGSSRRETGPSKGSGERRSMYTHAHAHIQIYIHPACIQRSALVAAGWALHIPLFPAPISLLVGTDSAAHLCPAPAIPRSITPCGHSQLHYMRPHWRRPPSHSS